MNRLIWSRPLAFVGAIASILVLIAPARADSPETDETLERAESFRLIEAWLSASMAFRKVPGMSVAVVKGDETIWSKGLGTIDSKGRVPATPQTLYSICSISKVFTSIAAMQLVEQGQLELDRPVTTYLPWAVFKEVDVTSGPVTLRGLMTHGSGVPREAGFEYWAAPDFVFPTREQVRNSFSNQTKLYGAYRYYQYSNLGLTLVGEAISAVSGEPYGDYLRKQVLSPLKLEDTRVGMPMDLYGKRLAVGHGFIKRDGTRDALKPFDTKGIAPAAGLTSTVEDLARFVRWQFRLLRTGKAEVLQSGTLRDMQRVQYVDPDWQFTRGLGFGVYRKGDQTYVGHSGECPGYFTRFMMHVPSETAVITMMNAAEPNAPYVDGIFAIMSRRKGFKFKGEAAAKIDLEPYAGLYSTQPWGSEQLILPWAGGLIAVGLPSGDPVDDMAVLKPKAVDLFHRIRRDGSEAEPVRFERDASGKVIRIIWHSNPSTRIADL